MTTATPATGPATASPTSPSNTATSLDGRPFSYGTSGSAPLLPGDLVVITTADGVEILGQVRDQQTAGLSQCDNLALMRMNSPSDVSDLAKAFRFAPEAMLRTAHDFAQGEVLVAGGFVPVPGFVQMGARLTYEGGSDVSVPLRAPAG